MGAQQQPKKGEIFASKVFTPASAGICDGKTSFLKLLTGHSEGCGYTPPTEFSLLTEGTITDVDALAE